MNSAFRIPSGLSRLRRQDRLRAGSYLISLNLFIAPLCLRWFVAFLAVMAFVVPAVMPSAAVAGESARSVLSVPAEAGEFSSDAESGTGAEVAENTVETFSGDYPHEADKILLMFALQWTPATAIWGGFYTDGQPPDPVFPFERPPKPFVV